jgi:hypothetical protein
VTTSSLLPTQCPYCRGLLDRATGREETRPIPGSISICIRCFQPSQFNELLEMQKLDWEQLTPDSRVRLRTLIREIRARLKHT